MDYIRKLPLLMGLTGAILTGLMGYTHQVHNNKNMANMVIAMVAFYIIGLMIRSTILDVIRTNERKTQEREAEEKRLAMEKEQEEERAETEAEAKSDSGSKLNLAVDEELDLGIGEEFSDLPIADYLKNELRK